jgi:hypothetical protein
VGGFIPAIHLFGQVTEVKTVYQHLDPFLQVLADGVLPQVLQVRYDTLAIINDTGRYHTEYLVIRIVQ